MGLWFMRGLPNGLLMSLNHTRLHLQISNPLQCSDREYIDLVMSDLSEKCSSLLGKQVRVHLLPQIVVLEEASSTQLLRQVFLGYLSVHIVGVVFVLLAIP